MKKVLVASLGLILFACGSPDSEMAEQKVDSLAVDSAQVAVDAEKDFKLHMIIANIPSPSHEIIAISKAGYSYTSSLVLDKAKAGKYPTEFKKGISYGIYSADLAYAASFPKNNDVLHVFVSTRKAAESANCLKVFEDITKAGHFDVVQSNTDSLQAMLERAYTASESYFETDQHMDVATRVLLGAWIEGQYIVLSTLSTQKSAKENDLKSKIWESKIHITNINELLTEYSSDADLAPIAASLKGYAANYDGATGVESFNKEKINKMLADLTAIRTKLVE